MQKPGRRESLWDEEIYVSDAQWEVLAGQIEGQGRIGRPRVDDRQMLNGILHVLVSGCRWNDLPREYGHYSTVWRRRRRWSADGTLLRLWRHLLGKLDEAGKLDWEHCALDGSYVPAKGGATKLGARAGARPASATRS